ncbi:MAG: hypothetical protein HYX47_00480 [Burkholderiales bacterium]|nr:hypothetical protein [Burkholderiales bacterium]
MSRITLMTALCLAAPLAQAQSSCSSDGQRQPVALLERFINADCESCWADAATPAAGTGELALDWIVPGSKGEDAPLSAAASRDALSRLQALRRPAPARMDSLKTAAGTGQPKLRVSHGLPFNGYMAASIEMKPARPGAWSGWLLLVETLPVGAEGSPTERNLVRNVLQSAWDGREQLSKTQQKRFFESRPMSIPAGANPERLRVVGWMQDGQGRIRAIAQSRCARATPGG